MTSSFEPDTSNAAIGARIVAVRIARDLTQMALAQAIGIGHTTLNNYERGLRTVPPDVVAKIWRVTGATSDYILMERMEGLPPSLRKLLIDQQDEDKTA